MSRARLLHADSLVALRGVPAASVDALVTDPPAGIEFMGKEWDQDHGGRAGWCETFTEIFAECLRVLKPGAHGLVWALPRTSHWTATALEGAGFEIRDVVTHLFGTGFPKSLNVSKAIDKAAGAEPIVLGRNMNGLAAGWVRQGLAGYKAEFNIVAPATDAARHWQGWGTTLKPAAEFWILVRKPLEGTVAANILAHGTGGLNIDGCRAEGIKPQVTQGVNSNPTSFAVAKERRVPGPPTVGRWPANLTLDEEAAALLDAQVGDSVGGPSRFFYVAKASRAERDAGLDDVEPASGGEATGREDGSDGLRSPRAGAGRGGGARNVHPTVKPVALMEWLIRLVTPPGGMVLDPFLGSGTTGVAAARLGFDFIGVERDAAYFQIARRRIAHAGAEVETVARPPRVVIVGLGGLVR